MPQPSRAAVSILLLALALLLVASAIQADGDANEPNDDMGQAVLIVPSDVTTGFIDPSGDVDWFRFQCDAGHSLQIDLYGREGALPADFDMTLVDPYEVEVGAASLGGLAAERIAYPARVSGEYYLRIEGWDSAYHATEPYYLKLAISEPCSDLIVDGAFSDCLIHWGQIGGPWCAEYDGIGDNVCGAVGGADDMDNLFYQDIDIPADPDTAWLSYWWMVFTFESGGPFDFCEVLALDPSDGSTLATLAEYNDRATPDTWSLAAIDLLQYPELLGRTIRLVFHATTDYSSFTTFHFDDVAVLICEAVPTPTPTATVPPDAYEENDSLAHAAAIDTGAWISAYIANSDDLDYYVFQAASGQTIKAQLTNMDQDANLELLDAEGEFLDDSVEEGTTPEQITYVAAASGDYVLLVYGTDGEQVNNYELRVDLIGGETATPTTTETCIPDTIPNSWAGAIGIAENTAYTEYICPANDEDWYQFTAEIGDSITLQLYNLPANYDLELWSPGNTRLDYSDQTDTTSEQIFNTASSSGQYRARVFSPHGAFGNSTYSVRVLRTLAPTGTATPTSTATNTPTSTPTTICGDDPHEPNDTKPQANQLVSYALVHICPQGDVDWFKFMATEGQHIRVELYNLSVDFDIEVYAPDGTSLGTAEQTGTASEVVSFTAAVSGQHHIRVHSLRGAFSRHSVPLKIERLNLKTPLLFSQRKHSQPWDIVSDAGGVYWSETAGEHDSPQGGIYYNRVSLDAYAPITVRSQANFSPGGLAFGYDAVFFREWDANKIQSVAAVANAPAMDTWAFASNLAASRGIEADARNVWYADSSGIHRVILATGNSEQIVSGSSYGPVNAMTSDSKWLYWTDSIATPGAGGTILYRVHRLANDGSGTPTTSSSPLDGTLKYIALANNYSIEDQTIYVASDAAIFGADPTGVKPMVALYATQDGGLITGIAVDRNSLYWTEIGSAAGELLFMPREHGGIPRVIVSGLVNPRALIDWYDRLYWSEPQGIMTADAPWVGGTAPIVNIDVTPRNPGVGETVLFSAVASDTDGITETQIIVDGALIKTCTGSPCSQSYSLTGSSSIVRFQALAMDTQGLRGRTPQKRLLINNTGPDTDNDHLSDSFERLLGTNPNNPDTDRDCLNDGWEVLGQSFSDGYLLDLPGMGADPRRPDVFVEVDWHRGFAPEMQWVQTSINEFRRNGVELHVDTGQWGGGGEIPFAQGSANPYDDTLTSPEARDPYSDPHRLYAFHYCLSSAHCPTINGVVRCNDGAYGASNITLKRDHGSEWGYGFFHELGHSLGMGHGGVTTALTQKRVGDYVYYDYAWNNINNKANFLSTMNYDQSWVRYQSPAGLVSKLGFSEVRLPTLTESSLDERSTSPFAQALASYPHIGPGKPVFIYYCDVGTERNMVWHNGDQALLRYSIPTEQFDHNPQPNPHGIDWDCDGVIEPSVAADINHPVTLTTPVYSVLSSEVSWRYLPLKSPNISPAGAYSAAYVQAADWTGGSGGLSSTWDLLESDNSHDDPDPMSEPGWLTDVELCDGADNDGDGDIDEGCPDSDGDSVPDYMDNCPHTTNVAQADGDLDGIGDACDAPPEMPMGLSTTVTPTGVQLTWEPSASPDIVGYLVIRSPFQLVYEFQAVGGYPTVDSQTTEFLDTSLIPPGRYTYRVAALGVTGETSLWSQSIVTISDAREDPVFLPALSR